MQSIFKGMLAGFVATAVMSALMMIKSMMGLMPELDVIAMLSRMMGSNAQTGWMAHFAIGTIMWGGLFGAFNGEIPGNNQILKGILFGLGAWAIMMVAVMPMAGAGFFGLKLGPMAPIMTGMLHAIFGAAMGWVYSLLRSVPELAV